MDVIRSTDPLFDDVTLRRPCRKLMTVIGMNIASMIAWCAEGKEGEGGGGRACGVGACLAPHTVVSDEISQTHAAKANFLPLQKKQR
jgi:hypothetical protein